MILWEGYRESRRCSRDTYPESYITEYILIYEEKSNAYARQIRYPDRTDGTQSLESVSQTLQGYLADKKTHPPRTLP